MINSNDLKNILDFIYNGELQIYQDHLDNFLDIAQRFQLEGLIQGKDENKDAETEQFDTMFDPEDDYKVMVNDFESNTVKAPKEKIISKFLISTNHQNIEEIDQTIEKMMEKVDGVWKCMTCGRTDKAKGHMKEHIEIHIDGLSFPCQFCDKTYRSRLSLRSHVENNNFHF